jgi:uncharacterized cupredoxin-like copper-binding protein
VLARFLPRRRAARACLAAGAIAAAAFAALACGSSGKATPIDGAIVAVTERDFHIAAPAHLKPGLVDLRVHNDGPDDHELILVPAPRGGVGRLPLRKDGLTVNEEVLQSSEPGSLEPGEPGSVRNLQLNLKPGRYILFCNMEGHFMGGMHTEVVVGS